MAWQTSNSQDSFKGCEAAKTYCAFCAFHALRLLKICLSWPYWKNRILEKGFRGTSFRSPKCCVRFDLLILIILPKPSEVVMSAASPCWPVQLPSKLHMSLAAAGWEVFFTTFYKGDLTVWAAFFAQSRAEGFLPETHFCPQLWTVSSVFTSFVVFCWLTRNSVSKEENSLVRWKRLHFLLVDMAPPDTRFIVITKHRNMNRRHGDELLRKLKEVALWEAATRRSLRVRKLIQIYYRVAPLRRQQKREVPLKQKDIEVNRRVGVSLSWTI